MTAARDPRVAILTYSTRPRGGVVHALRLAEELDRLGSPTHLFALGDPELGFFRPTTAPHTILPAPPTAETLEERVFASVDAMAEGLGPLVGDFDIAHAEDCIAARAALRIRDSGATWRIARTVHHVDDFTTRALVECQDHSIREPDTCLVVSEHWRRRLRDEYGVQARVVTNGVDVERFGTARGPVSDELRARIGARDRFIFLTVGGVEPRKGSLELFEALAEVRSAVEPSPILAIVGGHSFQDYEEYRRTAFDRAASLGLREGDAFAMLGTVDDAELPSWYAAADAFVFPSVKEGFGIVVLEALAASLPVITTDLPVFREYLTNGRDVVMVPVGDARGLADAMLDLVRDEALRRRLRAAGPPLARYYSWERSARAHAAIYREIAERPRRATVG